MEEGNFYVTINNADIPVQELDSYSREIVINSIHQYHNTMRLNTRFNSYDDFYDDDILDDMFENEITDDDDTVLYNDMPELFSINSSSNDNQPLEELYDSVISQNTEDCSICLQEEKINCVFFKCNAKHEFCKDCLIKWLSNNKSCPLCRNSAK